MKFTTIVLIGADPVTLGKIKNDLLKKSKTYPSKEMLGFMALLPNIDLTDNVSIANALAEIQNTETGVDERGVYIMDFAFKDALIKKTKERMAGEIKGLNFCDDYEVFDLRTTDDLLDGIDQYDRFPDSIMLPSGELVRSPKAFMSVDESSPDYKEFLDWKDRFKTILKKYSDHSFSLVLDCHI